MQEHGGIPLADTVEDPAQDAVIAIEADLSAAINYACWQNSVPFLRSLKISNNSEETLDALRLELSTVPGFAQGKSWTVDRIRPGEETELSDRHVRLDPEFLSGLNEAERGVVELRLFDADDRLVTEATCDVRLLARDEWGGFSSMAAITAAFVMPNDPAVAGILKDASAILAAHGHSSALDGYQSRDPRRAYMLGAAIWSAVAARRVTYAEPPRSFERHGQKVRRPGTIVEQGLATCFDFSLLFASALEAVGLNPFVILLDGHSLTGFWLVEKTFPNLLETDPSEVRKALAAREVVTFETTVATQTPPATFETAISMARKATTEQEEDRFVAAIDIARARAAQILPLASHDRAEPEAREAGGEDAPAPPLPPAPDLGAMPVDRAEDKPTTPAGRIERWQRKLLDLSLRNRLLNFRPTKQTIPFVCPDVPFLEDRLADQVRIRVVSLPEHNPQGERDRAIHLQTTGKDLDREFALEALKRDELSSPLEPDELDARLIALYRRAKNDINEGGSNTLFLAVGFLRWKKSPDDERSYRAPLLLVPIRLERRSAASRFHLLHHEDEVRFNATLLQLLKKDFDLDLPQFEGELPRDESGVDVPLVLERMRRAVRDIAGFEVINETALSTFSFAKYLMWKDLVDRTDALRNNRVVHHLIDNPDTPFAPGGGGAFPGECELDAKYHPKDIVNPLPADSSQLAAMMAAAEGLDFVLIGPPGTGKSQTIANMIAQCLAGGRSVLFVAEKTAALNVVYRRLREHGLGDYCLELHSNKAERRAFLGQMKASWEAAARDDAGDWVEISEKLRVKRDELNGYVEALHRRSPSGWTVFEALGVCVRGRDDFAPELLWEETVEHDKAALDALRQLVDELALTRQAVRPLPALDHVTATDWSVRWQRDLVEACEHLRTSALDLKAEIARFCPLIGMAQEVGTLDGIRDLVSMADLLGETRAMPLAMVFEEPFERLKAATGEFEEAVRLFGEASDKLAGLYSLDAIVRIPVDSLERDWREASAAIWPKSALARRRVTKLLQGYAAGGKVDPERDLPRLRIMQHALASLDHNPLRGISPYWQGVQTDPARLRDHVEKAEAVRLALMRVGRLSGDMDALARAVGPAIVHTETEAPLFDATDRLCASMRRFQQSAQAYCERGGSLPDDRCETDILNTLVSIADEIIANQTALQVWTEWCGLRGKARAHGLGPLVDAVEAGTLRPDDLARAFELAYARWWLPGAIDRDPVLRGFRSYRHEEILRDFRALDDHARSTAAIQVRRSLARDLPRPQEVPRRSELGLLRHQMELQRPSRSIREMIAAMPETFGKLAPCLLMSPLSIAQYLPADQAPFDVVIFDEASQITTWDAIGSIARGRQTIIVGDPRQLPPTNFFGRSDDGDDAPEIEIYERDLESILDEAKASGLPVMQLNWHYRSRHESLIAFSNWHYYQNRLITFPAPVTSDRAVWLRHLPSGIYDRGKSRTNRAEADAIVHDACERMVEWLDLPEDDRPTLGVITFNSQQQSLIENLFDEARRDNPELEWFFSEERIEPVIVRNLENVQGDERGVMMFSITYGPDHAGRITMSFGAVNHDGGERRLNVAVTRAREELIVYASITADKIDTSRTRALGVHHLKSFLDYAERGPVALPAEDRGSVGSFDSPFEEAVATALGDDGWTVIPQIGVSGFRIDLGIVHPDRPGAFLAGIECDGATYHRAATARDRDKVREQVLRGLGWEILRVWSPDWWHDRDGVSARLREDLTGLLAASREAEAARRAEAEAREAAKAARPADDGSPETVSPEPMSPEPMSPEAVSPEAGSPDAVSSDDEPAGGPAGEDDAGLPAQSRDRANGGDGPESPVLRVASGPGGQRPPIPAGAAAFRCADLSGFRADADRFFDFGYRQTLRDMIAAVLEAEAPVREDVLARRIARAHGWLRTGSRIREQIQLHLREVDATEEQTGRFLWPRGTVSESIAYREPASEEDRRPVSEIAIAELVGCVESNPDLLDEADPALSFARLIGLDRLAAASRARLEDAISLARERA